jgi:hypothetical protein
MALPCPAGTAFFSGAQLQHRLAIGFLERFDLPLILFAGIFGLRPRSVLHARLALLDPLLDLRGGQVELPGSLRNSGLPLDNLQNQSALATRRPTLDLFIHRNAHQSLLWSYYLSRNPLGHCTSAGFAGCSGYIVRRNVPGCDNYIGRLFSGISHMPDQ